MYFYISLLRTVLDRSTAIDCPSNVTHYISHLATGAVSMTMMCDSVPTSRKRAIYQVYIDDTITPIQAGREAIKADLLEDLAPLFGVQEYTVLTDCKTELEKRTSLNYQVIDGVISRVGDDEG